MVLDCGKSDSYNLFESPKDFEGLGYSLEGIAEDFEITRTALYDDGEIASREKGCMK